MPFHLPPRTKCPGISLALTCEAGSVLRGAHGELYLEQAEGTPRGLGTAPPSRTTNWADALLCDLPGIQTSLSFNLENTILL